MKSLMHLVRTMLLDLGASCCVSTTRDFETITRRVKHEGLSFLTITLPSLCKDFERDLSLGEVGSTSYLGFSKHGRLPRFLGGFFDLIFDRKTGKLHTNPSVDAIFSIRQLLLAFKKFESECTPSRVRATLEQYVLTDLSLDERYDELEDYHLDHITSLSKILFNPVLSKIEALLEDPLNILPRHGPGTTACGTKANDKYKYTTWTERLQRIFPYDSFLLSSWNDERALKVEVLSPAQEPPVRVVTVPKTLKGPRIIAIEPVHMQYVQQGLLEKIVPALESHKMYGALGFTDQTISQQLAQLGSRTGELATLDLSEASDRVSIRFVRALLKPWPRLLDAVEACRSTRADVPGFGVITLAKFASMGSALCFPIEAMAFLTILFAGKHKSGNYPLAYKDRSKFLRQVRVYGDDIVIPVKLTQSAVNELSFYGLKVNQHKSFSTGKFRESCGGDFYDGVSVKPTYIHTRCPSSLRDVREVESTVSLRNLFYKSGLWKSAQYLDKVLSKIAPFPNTDSTSPVLGRFSYLGYETQKLCDRLYRPLVFGMVPRRARPVSMLDGYGALMKFFLKRGEEPFFSKDHLVRDGRPKVAAINLRWAPSC